MLIHTRAGGSESDCGKKTEDVIAKHILQKKMILLLLLYLEPFSMADISINVFIGTLTPAVTCHFNRLVAIVDDT